MSDEDKMEIDLKEEKGSGISLQVNPLKKGLYIFFVLCNIILINARSQVCPPETSITTNITSNTTWSTCGSPYIISANATVVEGVTLTIEPGVVVKFSGSYTLQVDGALTADGVTFTSGKATPAKNDWYAIKFTSLSGTSSTIKNSTIEYSTYGINCVSASPTISGNTIRQNTYGIRIEGNSSPPIQNNTLSSNTYGISASGSSVVFNSSVSGNTISDGSGGIYLYGLSGATQSVPDISGNTIKNNTFGILYYGNIAGGISYNNILNNSNGIQLNGINQPDRSPMPLINNNNIYDNLIASGYTNPSTTVINAQNNWWGSTDPFIIGGKITDYSDSPTSSPVIDWSYFLDGPYPGGNPVPGTYIIGGTLACNSSWSSANSPYILIGSPVVSSGCSLNVGTNTTVKFAGNFTLTVDGTLVANGAVFTSAKATPAKSNWQFIKFTSSSSTSSSIRNSTIEYSNLGIYCVSAWPTISGNTIRQNYYGIRVDGTSSALIENNTITGNNFGIYAPVPTGAFNSIVRGNTINGGSYGIYVDAGTSSTQSQPSLSGNTISGNGTGIYYRGNIGGGITDGNVLTNNSIGIQLNGTNTAGKNPVPIINNNNIYDNTTWHIQTGGGYPDPANTVLDARYNWYGTVDGPKIRSKIYDYSNNSTSAAKIQWEPYRDAPYPGGALVMWLWINAPVPYGFDPATQSVDFSSHVAEPSNWIVSIKDFNTQVEVRRYTQANTQDMTFIWAGDDNNGIPLPEGWYSWSIDTTSTVSSAVGITQASHILMASLIKPTITINVEYPVPNSTIAHVYGEYVFFPTDTDVKGEIWVSLQPDNVGFYYQKFTTYSGTYAFDYDTCGLSNIAHTLKAVAQSRGIQAEATTPFNKVNSAPGISLSSLEIIPDSLRTLSLSGIINFYDTTWSSRSRRVQLEVKRVDNGRIACKRDNHYKEKQISFEFVCNLCGTGRGRYQVKLDATGCGVTNTIMQEVDY